MAIKVFIALLAGSKVESLFPEGNFFEKKNSAAANKNSPPTNTYRILIESKESSFWANSSILTPAITPNNAIETTIGPIVVPNELIPPARFNLLDAECGSPSEAAKGCADVCCNEKT